MWWLQRVLKPLPPELVSLIWTMSFPRVYMRCSACGNPMLMVDIHGSLSMTELYSIYSGRCVCSVCIVRQIQF